MRNYFEFVSSAKIKCGEGAAQTLGSELLSYGVCRPLVILSIEVVRSGIAGRAIASVNEGKKGSAVIFDGVPKNLSVDIVREMKQIYERENCDSVVAIGGASVIDSAKLLKLLLSENSEDISSVAGIKAKRYGLIPSFFLPTEICGGAESDGMIEESDAFISSPEMVPNAIFIDKEIAEKKPLRAAAEGAVYALANAIEAYLGASEDDVTEIYAEKSVKLIDKYAKRASERASDGEAATGVALASALSGVAYGNVPFGAAHALAEAIHDVTGESKAEAMTHVLVGALRCLRGPSAERFEGLMERYFNFISKDQSDESSEVSGEESAEAPKTDSAAVGKVARFIEELTDAAGVTGSLSATDIPRESFGAIAETAQGKRAAATSAGTYSKDDFLEILNAAY